MFICKHCRFPLSCCVLLRTHTAPALRPLHSPQQDHSKISTHTTIMQAAAQKRSNCIALGVSHQTYRFHAAFRAPAPRHTQVMAGPAALRSAWVCCAPATNAYRSARGRGASAVAADARKRVAVPCMPVPRMHAGRHDLPGWHTVGRLAVAAQAAAGLAMTRTAQSHSHYSSRWSSSNGQPQAASRMSQRSSSKGSPEATQNTLPSKNCCGLP